jgi:hypothetical protein
VKADARYLKPGEVYVQHAPCANVEATCNHGCGRAITKGSLRFGVVTEFKRVPPRGNTKAGSPVTTRLYFSWAHIDCVGEHDLGEEIPNSIRQCAGYGNLDAASKVRCILATNEIPNEDEIAAAAAGSKV